MANEKPSKVVYGDRTLIDLTSDTVVESVLIQGYTAHKADGSTITGTAQPAKEEQRKEVTAGTSGKIVTPDSGKTLSRVDINPTPSEIRTVTAGTSQMTVDPSAGKYISQITINPTPSQSKTVYAEETQQIVYPDSDRLLSSVVVKPQEHHARFDGADYTVTFRPTGPPMFYAGAAVVFNNEIWRFGSYEADYRMTRSIFNGTTGQWTSESGSEFVPYHFYRGCAVVLGDEIHLLGTAFSSTEAKYHYRWYDSHWFTVSTLPYAFDGGSAVVYNGEIHIFGGTVNPTAHYKWNGSSWVSVSTLPYSFYHGSAVVYNGKVHLLGGSGYTKMHIVWDGLSWVPAAAVPYDFYYGSAVVYNNSICIFGGMGKGTYCSRWTRAMGWEESVCELPLNFYQGSAVVYKNKVHLLGGLDSKSTHCYTAGISDDMGGNHDYRYISGLIIPSADIYEPIKTLLWSNPSPTANFSAQNIILNTPANNFSWLLVEYKTWKSRTYSEYELVRFDPDNPNRNWREPSNGQLYKCIYVGSYFEQSYAYVRRLYFPKSDTNWTKMYCTAGARISNSTTNNEADIPLAIYGVNNLPVDWLSS